jgi:N-acetylglucosamine kinase-like BadF-type ATPase
MKHIMAYDGGGTKTHLAVFDELGHLLYEQIGLGCNHTSSDGHRFKSVIQNLFQDALTALHLDKDQIDFIFLGLSGADLPSDFEILNRACHEIFSPIPFKVENDAWIVMRSGLNSPYGAVAISGTGTNSAAMNKSGKKAILRSLGYTLGIYGGGLDIAREGLHYAFRADELTYMDTMLRKEIPKLLGKKDMNDVVDLFYPQTKITKQQFGEITALVHQCADQKDQVSINILTKIGICIAEQTAGVMKQVLIDQEKVPVVIGGRVLSSTSPYLVGAFTQTIQSICPKCYIVKPKYKPVVGAYLFALDIMNIKQNAVIDQNLDESGVIL